MNDTFKPDIKTCEFADGTAISLDAEEFSAAMAMMPDGTDQEAVAYMGKVVRDIGWTGDHQPIPADVRDSALVSFGKRMGEYMTSLGNEQGSRPT